MKYLYKLSLLIMGFVAFPSESIFGTEYPSYTIEVKVTPNLRPVVNAESLINEPRVQLFSIQPATDFPAGHDELERLRTECLKSAINLNPYTALLVSENGSKYVRGQLAGFGTKGEADRFADRLKAVLPTGPHTIPAGTVSQAGFTLHKGELHNWK